MNRGRILLVLLLPCIVCCVLLDGGGKKLLIIGRGKYVFIQVDHSQAPLLGDFQGIEYKVREGSASFDTLVGRWSVDGMA